jgi:cap1 methyltransferase
LYIISLSFEKVYIYKPETSRPANSEKYLVCLYYKDNLSESVKNNLLDIIEIWNNITNTLQEDETIIFENIKIDNNFIQHLNEYNEKYIDSQLFYLNNTIKLAENKIEKNQYYEIIQKQLNNAINWCTKYNIEINKDSIYYKKNINHTI